MHTASIILMVLCRFIRSRFERFPCNGLLKGWTDFGWGPTTAICCDESRVNLGSYRRANELCAAIGHAMCCSARMKRVGLIVVVTIDNTIPGRTCIRR